MGEDNRRAWIKEWDYDCFITEEDKLLCEMMCGGVEDGE
jgi:hypothetical protein